MSRYPGSDDMRVNWEEMLDAERSVYDSTNLLRDVVEYRFNPIDDFERFKQAVEPQVDGPDGKPARALTALHAAQDVFLRAEYRAAADAGGDISSGRRVFWRSEYEYLRGRLLHVSGHDREALTTAYALVRHLVDVAEQGVFRHARTSSLEEAAEKILRSPESDPLTVQLVQALSILAATVKRNKLKPSSRARLMNDVRRLVKAYLLDRHGRLRDDVVICPKSAALAAQAFYLFKAFGDAEDAALIEALYRFDVRVRPPQARWQLTCCLRDLEYARWKGDHIVAESLRARARVDLQPLRRIAASVEQQGYLRAA